MREHEQRFSSIDRIPNPFERRQYAFQVLPEEKDPMSRAKNYSWIFPTLRIRLLQLVTTRLWEYLIFVLSIWSFIPLLIGEQIESMDIVFELTQEIIRAALFIEVSCKLYADCRWFFYDIWNTYDLICAILNSPLIYNLFLPDHLGVPQLNSIQRLFRTLHVFRFIRIHSMLRFVVENIFVALSSIYNILLLEFVIVTVFALLSIAFEGDTPFWDSGDYEPYENYTEAMYSYYMCITLEGVNEVAEQILNLNSPHFTTIIGLAFYIFAAIVTYSFGQLLAAVIASTLGKAIDQINREQNLLKTDDHPRLIGIQRPTINSKRGATKHRRTTFDNVQNFSRIQPDDLALLIIIYQTLEKNLNEFDRLLYDIRQIAIAIGKLNQKVFLFSSSNNEHLFLQQHRMDQMIKTLNKILKHITDDGELLSPLGEFLLIERDKPLHHPDDIQKMFQIIEEKISQIQSSLKKNTFDLEQNQRHLQLIDRFKEKFFRNEH